MAGQDDKTKVRENESINRWLIALALLYFFVLASINSDKYRPYVLPRVSLLFLISAIPLFLYHKGSFAKLIGFSAITYLVVMIAEILSLRGLHFFGIVSFGSSLGWRIMGVPIIKGVLWFGFIYCSCILVSTTKTRISYKALLVAILVSGIDVIIEKAASAKTLDFWSFGKMGARMNIPIPLTQYLVWGIIAFGLGFYYFSTFGKTKNNFVKYYLLFTILFFFIFYFLWGL